MNKIYPIIKTPQNLSHYYKFIADYDYIYQSEGLIKHITKRHPECIQYLNKVSYIIENADYIGINPNEKEKSFELVKILHDNVQLGIKLDIQNNYLYIATLYTITQSKLEHRIQNKRLKKIDRQ